MALALKSGNFGAPDFFLKAWERAGMTAILSEETRLRDEIVEVGRSLFDRLFTFGSTGNISARLSSGELLMTPTNASLGRARPGAAFEAFPPKACMSAATSRPRKPSCIAACIASAASAGAVVHLHSTHAVAVSILDGLDPDDVLPPLTAYYVMRVGRLPLVPYFPPGDEALAEAVGAQGPRQPCGAARQSRPGRRGQDVARGAICDRGTGGDGQAVPDADGRPIRPLRPEEVSALRSR
ncbi:MAG: class II aldolase/adducin family protein [Micropruina sp.]